MPYSHILSYTTKNVFVYNDKAYFYTRKPMLKNVNSYMPMFITDA